MKFLLNGVFTPFFLLLLSSNFLFSQSPLENKAAISKYKCGEMLVHDFEHDLSDSEIKSLEKVIENYRDSDNREIHIVTVDSYAPYNSMGDFSRDLIKHWKVGKGKSDSGLVIFFSKHNGSVRIESKYEGDQVLTPKDFQKIIDSKMIPLFSKHKFYDGLNEGVKSCIQLWEKFDNKRIAER